MSSVACHHRPWTVYHIRRRQACHDIIALGKHPESDEARRGIASFPLDRHGGTTSAWYAIIVLGQHIRLENVRRVMPSWPLSRTHGRPTSGVAGDHLP
ncbi:hypothetical protein EJD97_014620 [Solanum chilense]|uniref:Uncharacterized protein n=1 Tax=Solanum chilense TaxID=4083 RepID=A0A6N2ALN4_SOLCI|nr:hypothetical protein EJD97_014620 [Solanum chilense]